MASTKSRISLYIRENPGADFIAAFIVALIIVALIYPFTADIANELTNFAFFSLIAGVILQALALRRKKEDST
jgi:predicted ABC-type exoprotein transport system permease subunit